MKKYKNEGMKIRIKERKKERKKEKMKKRWVEKGMKMKERKKERKQERRKERKKEEQTIKKIKWWIKKMPEYFFTSFQNNFRSKVTPHSNSKFPQPIAAT